MSEPSESTGATAVSAASATGPSARGPLGETLLEMRDLQKHFPLTQGVVFKRTIGHVRAVDGVNMTLRRGETVGLVGESGCGKSVTSLAIMGLLPDRGNQVSGTVTYGGEDLL